MKPTQFYTSILLIISISALSACGGANPNPENIPCVGFREYVIGHQFPNPWDHIGFKFTGNPSLTIGGVNNVNGLKIDDGIRVELPGVTDNVTFQAMAFGNLPITIDGLDSQKTYVAQVIVPDDDSLHIVHLSADEISTITLTGGDHEAFLIEICIGDFYREQ